MDLCGEGVLRNEQPDLDQDWKVTRWLRLRRRARRVRFGVRFSLHDRTGELYGNSDSSATFLVLPQTIASYYAVLANLVLDYSSELSELGLVSQEELQANFDTVLEPETVPRRFFPRRWLAERLERSTAKQPEGE